MTKRAVIYSRISRDADLEGKGVQRQREDCEALCSDRGYTVVEVYEDNDVSAAGRVKKARPSYAAMLAAAAAGEFDVIVAYSNSRLTRRPRELEDLIDLHRDHGTVLNTVVSGDDDLSTADGRLMARLKANIDAGEAEKTAERLTRQKAQRAAEGKAQGGRYRVYGYSRDWQVIEEEEAIVKEVFDRRVKGESTTAIAADLAARGELTVAGNLWTQASLSKVLVKPGYAGLMDYKGKVIGKTSYPAIIDEATFHAAQSNLLKDSKGTNTRKHLLSGFLVCSKCFSTMKGNAAGGKPSYRCPATPGACGSMSIKMAWADEPVLSAMWKKQQDTEPVDPEARTSTDDLQAELDAIDARIEDLKAAYSAEQLTLPMMLDLKKTEDSKRADVVKRQAETVVTHWGLFQPFMDWEDMNLAQKRVFVERYISNVMVYPPKNAKGKNVRDDSRLEVHFKDGSKYRLSNPRLVDRFNI